MTVVPGQGVGIAARQLDRLHRHPQPRGRQLQHAAVQAAGAHIHTTGNEPEGAVFVGLDQCLGAPGAAHPPVAGQPFAGPRRGGLAPFHRVRSFLQALFYAHRGQSLPRAGGIAVFPGVLQPKGQPVHAHCPRHLVHVRFHREGHLRSGWATNGTLGLVVGVGNQAGDIQVGYAIRPAGHKAAQSRGVGAVRAVSAGVEQHAHLLRDQAAVVPDPGFDVYAGRVAQQFRRGHFLVAAQGHLHR